MKVVMPAVAAKVWCPANEPEPMGLFNRATCPQAPANWFREEPADAAELFGLEIGVGDFEVHVLDTAGVLHRFNVSTARDLNAHVKAL